MFLDMAYNPQQRMQIGMVEGAMQQTQDQYLQTRLFEAKARKDGLDKGPAFARKRSMLEMDILVRALFERDGAKLQEKIKVSDEDIKAFYDKNTDKFQSPETFTARHILLSSKESPAPDAKTLSEEELKAKVVKVQDALKGGKKFEDLAKEFSDDPGSKEKGGLYENISFGSFVPEFEVAVRAQKIGEVGAPVKTQYGYHLILVEKLTPGALQTFEAAKEKAQQLATQARQEQVMKEFVDSVKKEIPFTQGPGPEKVGSKQPKPAVLGSN
jgi:peptidyl-prolyl cis-trans isomerase C